MQVRFEMSKLNDFDIDFGEFRFDQAVLLLIIIRYRKNRGNYSRMQLLWADRHWIDGHWAKSTTTKICSICFFWVCIANASFSTSINWYSIFDFSARDLGHSASTSKELIKFLKQIPAEELMKHTSNSKFVPLEGDTKTTYIEWNPTIESKWMLLVISTNRWRN